MTEGNTINGLALCAGTGGLELGLHIAEPRLRTVGYVEREAAAAASLVARMEDKTLDPAPIWDDLGTFDGRPWRGVVDIITSGDPCQPNSTAGKRQGEDDDRWMLDQVIRIIDETRPARVFRENVTGNADGQLRVLVPALEGLGFRVAVGIFAASEVGANHRRERLFFLADATHIGHERRGLSRGRRTGPSDGCKLLGHTTRGGRGSFGAPGHQGRSTSSSCLTSQHMANAFGTGSQGPGPTDPERGRVPSALCGTGEALPLFAPGPGDFEAWREILAIDPTLEPALCGISHGLAYRNDRLRLGGNGVFPLAAAYAYRTLAAHFDTAGTGSTDAVLSVA